MKKYARVGYIDLPVSTEEAADVRWLDETIELLPAERVVSVESLGEGIRVWAVHEWEADS